jgi:hypothetical protein
MKTYAVYSFNGNTKTSNQYAQRFDLHNPAPTMAQIRLNSSPRS